MASTESAVGDRGVEESDRCSLEHVLNDEDGSMQCVLMPADSDTGLASEWMSAEDDSYVSLVESR